MNRPPVRLVPKLVPKVWGATKLEPWHQDAPERIGEIWLQHPEGVPLPLLVKFLYTSEALSVQVHPGDDYARLHENSSGKTEMWVILRAEPGARIAHGLREQVSRERLQEAARSGEIEGLLNWVGAAAEDVLFTPAGVIHAIGAGITLCEIQQNSDVTYRLYDYGRPRELHVHRAVEVSRLEPGPMPAEPVVVEPGRELLVRCDHFTVERLRVRAGQSYRAVGERMLILLEGEARIGDKPGRPGDAWLVEQGADCEVQSSASAVLLGALV
jgi:mannose-6-phosphate isomerase